MLNAHTMLDASTWRQELDTLFARLSDHYVVDENTFVGELIKVLDTNSEDFRRIAGNTVLGKPAEQTSLIAQKARVGNVYVNRNIIGAMVGVQPFGGQGLSGTGPKAGGPH